MNQHLEYAPHVKLQSFQHSHSHDDSHESWFLILNYNKLIICPHNYTHASSLWTSTSIYYELIHSSIYFCESHTISYLMFYKHDKHSHKCSVSNWETWKGHTFKTATKSQWFDKVTLLNLSQFHTIPNPIPLIKKELQQAIQKPNQKNPKKTSNYQTGSLLHPVSGLVLNSTKLLHLGTSS